jgi:hypothetical protein
LLNIYLKQSLLLKFRVFEQHGIQYFDVTKGKKVEGQEKCIMLDIKNYNIHLYLTQLWQRNKKSWEMQQVVGRGNA